MKDLGKKKLLIIAGGIIGLVVLIIIILLIYNAIFGKTSYKDIENKVLRAAKEYYGAHSELLPKNENEQVSTTDTALTAAGYLKSMSELTKGMDVSCSATVMVSYAGGEYRYTPLLNCGDKYSSKTLTSYIMNNESKVFTGEGLYDLNGELVFRGEDPNNYVKLSGKMWRIVKIQNNQAVLILNDKFERAVWDDRFNADRDRTDGINTYSVSRIKESLDDFYKGDNLFDKDSKNLVSVHTLYTGKRLETDNYNDGSIEKVEFLDNQYIGLLPLYDYINASIDENCNSAITDSCSNYNYLNHFDYNWWTITADASNTYKVFRVSNDGTVESLRASSNGYARPVIYLAKDALYTGGTGTSEDPYTIK